MNCIVGDQGPSSREPDRDRSPIPVPARMLIGASFTMDAAMAMVSLAVQNFGVYVLHAPNLVLGLFATFGSTGYTTGCLISGPVADRWGRKRSAVTAAVCVALVWSLFPWIPTWKLVLCLTPLGGFAMAFFWPALQAWLGETCGNSANMLGRVLGLFNIMWCAGLVVGPIFAGYLWSAGVRPAFWIPAGIVLLLATFTATIPSGESERTSAERREEAGDPPPAACAADPRTEFYLLLARIGNFAAFFTCGVILAMFPKIGATLGFSPAVVGWIIGAFRFGQTAVFAYTWIDHRWQYRLWPLPVSEVVGGIALILSAGLSNPAAFAIAFIVAGMCGGVTYVSSLFYSLHNRSAGRGKAAGIHEAVLGAGILAGPLVGGMLAQWVSLRSTLAGAGVVLGAAAAVQTALHLRRCATPTAVSPG